MFDPSDRPPNFVPQHMGAQYANPQIDTRLAGVEAELQAALQREEDARCVHGGLPIRVRRLEFKLSNYIIIG